MKIFKRLVKSLVFGGLNSEDLARIADPVAKDNRKAMIVWSSVATVFWTYSFITTFFQDTYLRCRTVFEAALAASVLSLLLSLTLAKKYKTVLYGTMYFFMASLLAVGIGMAICQPESRTVTMIVAVLIIPIGHVERTIIPLSLQIITYICYLIFTRDVLYPAVYSWGVSNLLIFGIVGILIGHVVNNARFRGYLYAEKAQVQAELQMKYAYYDQMTGLKNRRAYSETIEKMTGKIPDDRIIIMLDINGLKKTNDTLGHLAGDELIIGTAKCISAAFEGVDGIYRIGGDEFCIIMDGSSESAKQILTMMEKSAAGFEGEYINGISISYGIGTSNDADDVEGIIREADSNMYERKREYYVKSGADRRRRREPEAGVVAN